ncbi:hypothetical protein CVT25_014422 [Psilocybe cyanescens]|uniref:Uncharacterized protein n=1 Tax=Psilocybe cyanescens TaxID=93625 RepID=A0A409VZ66_PSICY|nr:hypothetical protein CVT25_014422 [Psilocybe cyanescens]
MDEEGEGERRRAAAASPENTGPSTPCYNLAQGANAMGEHAEHGKTGLLSSSSSSLPSLFALRSMLPREAEEGSAPWNASANSEDSSA